MTESGGWRASSVAHSDNGLSQRKNRTRDVVRPRIASDARAPPIEPHVEPMPSLPDAPAIPAALIGRLRKARSVAALTGAGISAESGVPTFRDAQTGLWAQFDPLELATPDAFRRNAEARLGLVRVAARARRKRRAECGTSRARRDRSGRSAISSSSRRTSTGCIAQRAAAASSSSTATSSASSARARARSSTTWDDSSPREAPRCAHCGAFLRPDVVWFEETLPEDALAQAEHAARDCDVLLVVGTAAEVYPAAMLPTYARHHGAAIVEVNPNPTRLSDRVDFVLRGPSGVVLPALVAAAWGEVPVAP